MLVWPLPHWPDVVFPGNGLNVFGGKRFAQEFANRTQPGWLIEGHVFVPIDLNVFLTEQLVYVATHIATLRARPTEREYVNVHCCRGFSISQQCGSRRSSLFWNAVTAPDGEIKGYHVPGVTYQEELLQWSKIIVEIERKVMAET